MPKQLSQSKLEDFLKDIRNEPSWRATASREVAYYDGKQLDANTLRDMEERGIAPLIRNLIGPTIDVVLGMEARNKRDWKVVGDTDPDLPLAAALNVRLKQAERVSDADMATSNAYASQLKAGLGWVEVARESNPFMSPYRVESVHRREVWWDWRSKRMDLQDARYLVRKQWFDEDLLIAAWPHKAQLIRSAIDRWALWDDAAKGLDEANDLFTAYETEHNTTLIDEEWRDADRRRLALHEVWYRVPDRTPVIRLGDDTVLEFDIDNPRHQMAVAEGAVTIEMALINRVRLAWWLGPHRLVDIPSPYPHNRFPYVPLWGYREDSTGIPYGLIRRMMSPQDEVNARLSKMMWLLSAKRVIADEDAPALPHKQVMDEVARPDAYILLNPKRSNRNADAFRVDDDFQLTTQQFQVMKDASVAINDTAGVYQSMLGKDVSGIESGIAINSLVEQGATTLAEINDNYRYARRLVGELLLSLVKEDIGEREVPVEIDFHGTRQVITLNQLLQDEDGSTYRSNDIVRTRMHIELDDVPNTASYRSQQLQNLTEITKSLPPNLQTLIVDLVVRATDLPQRTEIANRLAKATGQMEQNLTPDEQAEQDQRKQLEQRAADLDFAEREAQVRKTNAEAQWYENRAEKTDTETDKLEQDMALATDEHDMALETSAVDNTVKLRSSAQKESSRDVKPKTSVTAA